MLRSVFPSESNREDVLAFYAAFEKNGIPARTVPIRGGTDGAHLSWEGLPCPNLPTGGYNYHGVREWIPADSLEAMTNVLVTLTESFAE